VGNITTLSLNDGLTTPVARTFTPVSVGTELVQWNYKAAGSVLGQPTVTLGVRRPTLANGNRKVTYRVKVPVLETVVASASGYTPGPTVAYTLSANVDVVIPGRASASEIADLWAFALNGLQEANAFVADAVKEDDFPY